MKTKLFLSVGATMIAVALCLLGAQKKAASIDRELPVIPVEPVPGPVLQAEVPPRIRKIVGGVSASIVERLDSVHGLGDSLSEAEIVALYAFLTSPVDEDEKNVPGVRVLKNDILNVLRHQRTSPNGLTDVLSQLYRDRSQDPVVRDYAIQHLVTWAGQRASDRLDAASGIRLVLAEAAREDSSIAGTALLGMHRLSTVDPSFDAEIKDLALTLLRSSTADPAARVSVMQVCAERGLREALPTIESFVQGRNGLPLRLSAIAAIGRLGGPEHATQLALLQIESKHHGPLRAAIQTALKRLTHKDQLF